MTDSGQEDEFMKQYMETCKEQIEKLAKDPELLNQTLKPFMQMSQQLMGGPLAETMPKLMGVSEEKMSLGKMVAQLPEMVDYIKSSRNQKDITSSHSLEDQIIQDFDKLTKKLRSFARKIIESMGEPNKT